MSHNRNDSHSSNISDASSFSRFSIETSASFQSTSAGRSVAAYISGEYQNRLELLIKSDETTDHLIRRAEGSIESFSAAEESLYTYEQAQVRLDRIMSAMMYHAADAGGNDSQRYVASAIVIAGSISMERMKDLAVAWLTHLLYIFKVNGSYCRRINVTPSQDDTPLADDLDVTSLEGAPKHRRSTFVDAVRERDGYECVITGYREHHHPERGEVFSVPATHILDRAIATFDSDKDSDSYASAMVTYNILTHFSRLSSEEIESLQTLVDDVSNGVLLEYNARAGFVGYYWCFQKTDRANEYNIRVYNRDRACLRARRWERPHDPPVVFRDRSGEFLRTQKRSRTLSVPDPRFIAIHAAIAGILHMSGAGEFFDELLMKFFDDDGLAPLVRWQDFELYVSVRSALAPMALTPMST
ncbi:hypothetical protein QCA50_020263 [Cerrena zonata]|uniref:HNH nuclease domain-containing protein n=1 Tax=Cerrena zonata TaxID=2478898 RepID=A0AAW0FJI5_9APHY